MKVPAVLQVLPRLEFGGVERGTVEITAALAAAGWKAVIASAGGIMTKDIERAGGIHITAPLGSKNPWTMRRNVTLIERIIHHYGINIVHARSRAPAWSARAAARRQHVSFVTTFHGLYSSGNPLKKPYNRVMASGDLVIAVSEFTRRHVTEVYGVPPDRLRTIPRGVDTDIFDPLAVSQERIIQLAREWCLPDDAYVIMSPGRPSRRKGYSVLVEAARQLDHPNYRILLVGADHGSLRYRKKLRAQIQRNGLEGVVRLTAPCRDMAAAYMLADAVVFRSCRAGAVRPRRRRSAGDGPSHHSDGSRRPARNGDQRRERLARSGPRPGFACALATRGVGDDGRGKGRQRPTHTRTYNEELHQDLDVRPDDVGLPRTSRGMTK